MAEFLDVFGKTVSGARDKTKSMINITSLNSQLKSCENGIKEKYARLGEVYFLGHGANPAPDVKELCEGIQADFDTIASLKKKINKEKGIVACEKCGVLLTAGINFCCMCGAPIPKDEVEEPVEAPEKEPEAENEEVAKAEEPVAVVEENEQEEPVEEPATDKVEEKEETASKEPEVTEKEEEGVPCPHCGERLRPNALFCIGCGNKVK